MRRSLCKCLLLPVLFLLPLQVMRAQDDYQYRLEMGAGVGLVAYEGDLNGNILAHQQPMAAIVGRYNFDPYKDLRFNLGLGKLKGSNDKVKTDYPDLDGKAYSFSNTLVDMSLVFEYNFWPYGTGRDYRGAKRLVPFVFGGLGATFVKGDGKNVFTANVPLGIGAKYKVTDRLNVGVDWTITLEDAARAAGGKVALQGNLDPNALFASPAAIEREVASLLTRFGPGGHIFNLGHGISQFTDPEHVTALVAAVHRMKFA